MEDPAANEFQRPVIEPIFIGSSGLRTGWRLLLYVAAFYFLTYAVLFLSSPLISLIPETRLQKYYLLLIEDCIQFVAAVIPAIAMARLEQRLFFDYGLPFRQAFGRNFWLGALWGTASLTVLLVLMRVVGVFNFGSVVAHGMSALKFAVFWGALFLVVAFYEEFITRGYTQFTLTQGIGFWPAAVVLSVIFGAFHLLNPGENWHGALGAGAIGLFWCFTLRRTGTLWFGIGMHAAWDWCETFLYAVPDSGIIGPGHFLKSTFHGSPWLTGGSVGPEASVLLFVVIAAMWALFNCFYPEIKYKTSQ